MRFDMRTIRIGNVEIEQCDALAPMASVADRAYRMICKEQGAAYMVSEMISAKGLCYSDRKTEELCTVLDEERPMALQLFGDDPDFCARAAVRLMDFDPDIIDINMGCPVLKVVRNRNKYQKKLSQILTEYDRIIVVARDGYVSRLNCKVEKVSNFDDLLEIKRNLSKPIIYSRVNDIKSEFIVEDSEKVYKFVLKDTDC